VTKSDNKEHLWSSSSVLPSVLTLHRQDRSRQSLCGNL